MSGQPASSAAAAALSKMARIPPLLYGTAWKGDTTTALVMQAFAAGFRGIDTAGQRKHYREDLVGAAIAKADSELDLPREKLWIQTKFTPISGQDLTGPMPYDPDARPKEAIRKSFQTSLRNLHQGDQWACDTEDWKGTSVAYKGDDNTAEKDGAASSSRHSKDTGAALAEKRRPWIDSFLLHSPLNSLEATLEAWSEMEELALEGHVRLIGFSNIYDARILAALRQSAKRFAPRIVQNRWHHTSGHDVSLLSSFSPVLSPNDFAVDAPGASAPSDAQQANAIVYQPFWTLTGNPRLLDSDAVHKAASRLGWTAAQVVYRFVAQGFGIPGLQCTVLSGTTDETHMREVVHAVLAANASLDESEVDEIRRVVYGE